MKKPNMNNKMWKDMKDKIFNSAENHVVNHISLTPFTNDVVSGVIASGGTNVPAYMPYEGHMTYHNGTITQYTKESEEKADNKWYQQKIKAGLVQKPDDFYGVPALPDEFIAKNHELCQLDNIFAIVLNETTRYAVVFYMQNDSVSIMPSVELFRKIKEDISRLNIDDIQEYLEWIVKYPQYLVGLKSDYVSAITLREITAQYV